MVDLQRTLSTMFDELDGRKGIPALLGDGAGNVAHPTIANRIWIRLIDPGTGNVRLATAYNSAVANRHGLLVMVKASRRRGRRPYEVLGGYGLELYPWRGDWVYDHVAAHAPTHLWPTGSDIISLNTRQIIGLRAWQQDTPNMTLQVDDGWYDRNGYKEFAGGDSPTFTAPTTNWRWDLLVINTSDALAIETGTAGPYESVSIPTPSTGVVPICAVLLGPGQTSITETSIRDLRFVPRREGSAGAAGGTGSIVLTARGGAPRTDSGCGDAVKQEIGATNKIDMFVLPFNKDSDEYAQWGEMVMPSDWDGGTITARFVWTCAPGASPSPSPSLSPSASASPSASPSLSPSASASPSASPSLSPSASASPSASPSISPSASASPSPSASLSPSASASPSASPSLSPSASASPSVSPSISPSPSLAAQTVCWGLRGRSYGDDEAIDQALGTAQFVTDTLLADGDVHISAETAAITLAGTPAGRELVHFEVQRDVSEDNLPVDAWLISVLIEYSKS